MEMGVVYLTTYSGNEMPPFYIGSSTEERVAGGYHGTVTSKRYVKIWLQELKLHPELFKTKILSRHPSRKDAMIEEARLQRELDVVRDPKYVNLGIAAPNGFFGPSQRGVSKTAEHSEKISKALKGRTVSDETRRRCSFSQKNKGPVSESARLSLSAACCGSKNGRAKNYKLISPEGKIHLVSGGLRKFCKDHGLSMPKVFRHIDAGVIRPMDCKKQSSAIAIACTGWKVESL